MRLPLEATISNIVQSLLPAGDGADLHRAVLVQVRLAWDTDEVDDVEDPIRAERHLLFLYVRPANYMSVYVAEARSSWCGPKEVADMASRFKFLLSHDSCWREAPNSSWRDLPVKVDASILNVGLYRVATQERKVLSLTALDPFAAC
jgi:hypothetical protein